MPQLPQLARLMVIPLLAEVMIANPSLAQTAPTAYDDGTVSSLSAEDLYLDRLDYQAEPAAAIEPLPFLFSMQSRRQHSEEMELESLTIELNDLVLPVHQQRSGFSVSSPIE